MNGWSKGGQIFFDAGWAWGTAPNGKTVCMGEEDKVLKAMEDGTSLNHLGLDNILTQDKMAFQETPTTPLRSRRINEKRRKTFH